MRLRNWFAAAAAAAAALGDDRGYVEIDVEGEVAIENPLVDRAAAAVAAQPETVEM